MTDVDPFATQRGVAPKVTAELGAAGFEDPHEIGRGGFGLVYRCVQPSLDRIVAVKVLTADLEEENLARFFREQRAMGRLAGHPNIVGVLHVGTTDSGRPYIVMLYQQQDSLDVRIRRHGPLSLSETLRVGVKMAGALETAHRVGILHRDVKPANILVTDYGKAALTDFGIVHLAGGFKTGTGTVTGSPAFTAPEVLSGESPSSASDIYSLGATLFCLITGHAAFERRSGEHMVAQFLRITTQPVPDLREHGIAEDVSVLIGRAMATEPRDRPATAARFGDDLRGVQRAHGFPVDEMALHSDAGAAPQDQDSARPRPNPVRATARGRPPSALPAFRTPAGSLPLELTSFIGRRRELSEGKEKLSASRLVTLTGIGGVGKTRLALRMAADAKRGFADGVRLVDLADLRDESLLEDVVAAALGIQDQSARPLRDVVVEFLAARQLLLVVDNCEHVVDAVAGLVELLLHSCPGLRVVATSREPLGIAGEAVLRVHPLTVPAPDHPPSLRGMARYDAMSLFVERAAAAVPGFRVTDENVVTVARICERLDGLPLPIELAAARLRAMSLEQILQRLADRYALLTLGSRGAPTRQQTLQLCIDWSHDLCTSREQQVWARLSVFAGSFELDAAESICGAGVSADDLLDTVGGLVDKSILIREDAGAVVRFRMLETLRDYGRKKVQPAEYLLLRRRHRDWYQQLVSQAEAEWVGPRQLEWIARLEREQSNLREAMGFAVTEMAEADAEAGSEATEAGLRIASALFPFWVSRGLQSEGRLWLGRALARRPGRPTGARIEALYADSVLTDMQGDLTAGEVLVEEAQALAVQMTDPVARTRVAHARGLLALYSGDLPRACTDLEEALAAFRARGDLAQQVWILMMLGLAYELRGEARRAIACHQQVLDITQAHGESVYRSYSLWAMGVAVLQQGDRDQAAGLLDECLRLTRLVDGPLTAAVALEALAWIAAAENKAERAAALLGAAEALSSSVGSSPVIFENLLVHHEECERRARRALGERALKTAQRSGAGLAFADAVAYALGEQPLAATPSAAIASLTKRERQVADLVAGGLTNNAIAAQLVISKRTAQGHVEHILTKLGFTSRTQIAAWVVEQAGR
ncbi:protein kinase [Nocardia jiangxiensis]|uniref:Protein kinase n=1 Tax=Nocardia jiangxiensis TaxID=282685 RepID=A0ABW6SFF3_9NOCA